MHEDGAWFEIDYFIALICWERVVNPKFSKRKFLKCIKKLKQSKTRSSLIHFKHILNNQ